LGNIVLTLLTRRPPPGMGGGGLGIDISKPPITIRLMARSDPANAPRALTPVPMMLHNTPAGPHPANRIRPYHGGMGDPSLLTTATFSIIPTHIHTPIGVQSLAPPTSPHPTWLQGTNSHHAAPDDTLASCTPPNAHILNPHTGKWPSPHQAPAALSLPPLTLTDRPSYSCRPNQHSRTCPPLPSPTLSPRIPLARPPPLPSYAPAPTTTGIAI